jgi:hypothetical protein
MAYQDGAAFSRSPSRTAAFRSEGAPSGVRLHCGEDLDEDGREDEFINRGPKPQAVLNRVSPHKRLAVEPGSSKRDLIRTRVAFYSGAPGGAEGLAYLIDRVEYEELHTTIKREGRQLEKIQARRRRARPH